MASHKLNKVSEQVWLSSMSYSKEGQKDACQYFSNHDQFWSTLPLLCSLPYSLQLCGLWPKQWIHDSYLHEYHLTLLLQPIPFVVLHPSNFGQFWPVGKSIENQAGKNEVKVASWAHLFCPFGVCDICHRCVFLLCLNSKYKLWKSWSLFCWSINARFLLLSLWFSDLAKCKYCQATFLISIDLW